MTNNSETDYRSAEYEGDDHLMVHGDYEENKSMLKKVSDPMRHPVATIILVVLVLVSLIVILSLAIAVARFTAKQNNAVTKKLDNSQYIELITYNDVYQLHMVKTEDGEERGGPSRVSRYIQDVKSKRKYPNHVLVLSGGDTLSPSSMSTLFHGEQMIRANDILGLNYSALGNHEFDFGVQNLEQRVKESAFTWINSNVKLPFKTVENVVVKVGPVQLGLFGVLYDFGPADKTVVIEDVIQAAKKQVKLLKEKGAQYIVALTHQTGVDDCALSNAVSEINLIVGGHDHRSMSSMDCGHAMYLKASQDWINIWHVKIDFSFAAPLVGFSNIAITPEMPTDPQMEKLIAEYDEKAGKEFKVEIATADVTLDGREFSMRTMETNLGDYIADAFRSYDNSDISFTNGGGVRGNKYITAGTRITKGDVFDIFPFSNNLAVVSVNGSVLAAAVELGLSAVDQISGKFPVISGFRITYSLSRPVGSRVISMKRMVNDQLVDITPDMVMSMATSSFLHSGGDQFSMFAGLPDLVDPDTTPTLVSILMQKMTNDQKIVAQTDGRVMKV